MRFLRDIDALGCEFDADGEVEFISEDRFLIGAAIVVGVLIDEDFVIGECVAGAVVRVDWHGCDPEAAAVVEGHLHGVCEVRKLLFGGEHLDLVALWDGERLQSVVAVEVFLSAIFIAGSVVGFDLGEWGECAVSGGDVKLRAIGGCPDCAVADLGERAHFSNFRGIVFRAERFVAAAIDVDAIEHAVVVEPEPVLVLDGGEDIAAIALGLAWGFAEKRVADDEGKLAVAIVSGEEAIFGKRLGCGGVELASCVKDVDEADLVRSGDFGHGGGVESEIGIFIFAIREVAARGEVLEGNGGDQNESWGLGSVVFLSERVSDERVQLAFEVFESGGAVERLIVSEEGEERVGFEVGEPLVGCGVVAGAGVRFILRAEILSTGESPLRFAGRVRAEAGGVARAAEIPDD